MSIIIIGFTLLIIGVVFVCYWVFRPKAMKHSFFLSMIAFLLLEIGLYVFALHRLEGPIQAFLDIRSAEFNHSASFSSLLLMITALSAFSIFLSNHSLIERLYYLSLSLCFVFLALDEYFMIHETLPNWTGIYATVTLMMMMLGAWFFWRSKMQDGWRIYLALFGGVLLAATGSVGMELLLGEACFDIIASRDCAEIPFLEEVLETLGFILAATAAVYLIRPQKKPFVGVAAALWLGILLFSTWLQPPLEARFFAKATPIIYDNTPIQLDAIRLNKRYFRAGETLSIDLYWHSNVDVQAAYGYTINLLDPFTGETLWREDLNIAYPATNAWFSAATYRSHHDIVIPIDIETPISPAISIALWRKENTDYLNFLGTSSFLPMLADKFPIVDSVSVLSPSREFTPNYLFANGITLAAPELIRDNNRDYRLRLSWSTTARIEESLSYFIHFLGTEGQEHLIFDRQPFDNRFPTINWALGMVETDEIMLPLSNVAQGRYEVRIGLLDGMNRVVVTDAEGNLLPEASISLGEVEVLPD